jgi:hypothetical protein
MIGERALIYTRAYDPLRDCTPGALILVDGVEPAETCVGAIIIDERDRGANGGGFAYAPDFRLERARKDDIARPWTTRPSGGDQE